MTVLHHEDLLAAMHRTAGSLVVTPLLDPKQVGPASIDLRLGTDFLFLRKVDQAGLDPAEASALPTEFGVHEHLSTVLGQRLWIHPGQFLLGSTLEHVRMPDDLAGVLVGRSSWARFGLVVEMAGLVQPGYSGALTYELANMGDSPIALYPGLRVAQLVVFALAAETTYLSLPADSRFASKYVSAVGPEPSRLAWEEPEMVKLRGLGAK